MAVVNVNFGLVHHPPEFNYDTSLEDLPRDILEQLPEDTAEILQLFTEEELHVMRWRICWKRMARGKQLPPPEFETGEISIFGLRSGRGFGKTLAAANATGIEAATTPGYYGVVSPTHDDVRYTCFEGPTGLLSVIPPQLIVSHNSSLPMITLWNGSVIRGFAGDTPERLRGPNFHWVWADEIASWKYPEEAWSNIMFALRAGENPRLIWTGTPKPTPFVRKLQEEKRSIVHVGSTYENRRNLTEFFYENIAKYEGTKVGRQEIYGEVLDPEEEGIIRRTQWRMWPASKPLPKFQLIIYSLDTAFTEKTHDKKKQENDPTACSVWGMFSRMRGNKEEKHVMLLDAWEDWLGLPGLIQRVKREKGLTYGDSDEPLINPKIRPKGKRARHQGRKADIILIEEKGSGISLRQSLATENILTQGYNPGREDKLTRLHVVSPMWAHGRVWAVESASNAGTFRTWADPLIAQVCTYIGEGSTERDDLLDTTTQAMRLFMDNHVGALTTKRDVEALEKERQEARRVADRKKRNGNPYSQ